MSILLFLIVLLVLVLVHELGHFIVAKKAGIRVDEFAFGFPPRLFSVVKGETRYSFNALPLGGYVKIFGENPDEVDPSAHDKKRSFAAQHRGVQAAVIVAGVVMNVILAWALLSVMFMIGTPASPDNAYGAPVRDARLTVIEVRAGTPAAAAGLMAGDIITGITDGTERLVAPESPEKVQEFVGPREGKTLEFNYLRENESGSVVVMPVPGIVPDRGAVGISMDMIGTLRLPPHLALWEGGKSAYLFTRLTAVGIGNFFVAIFMGQADYSQVTGPVGIVQAVGAAATTGFANLLFLTALISINLAVINVIPFPALDGGRLLFVLVEAILRRPLPTKFQNYANIAGFALLMLLMVAVTWHDIAKL